MITTIIVIGLVVIAASVGLQLRNCAVHSFRQSLNSEIHRLNVVDINGHSNSYHWRREEYDVVSYDKMVLQFWRPLKSFYRDGFPEKEVAQ